MTTGKSIAKELKQSHNDMRTCPFRQKVGSNEKIICAANNMLFNVKYVVFGLPP